VRKDDVNVDAREGELAISGEIKERERKGIIRRRTRRVGQFDFHVTLPGGVNPDDVDANLDDGLLTVRIPKPEQTRPRRVEVRHESAATAPAGTNGGTGGGS
jgi:HSP20 family protein